MKAIFIVTVIFTLCARCSPKQADVWLAESERLMKKAPDSAFTLLKEIPRNTLRTREQQALFALLYSQALDKNYIDVTNDSLISIAVDYYNAHPEPYRLMLAYYYLSRIQYNAENYAASLLSAHKARKQAERISDYFYLGMIYRSISTVYNRIYNANEEIRYSLLSHQSFSKAHAEAYAAFAFINMGHAYYNNHEYEESIHIAQEAFGTASAQRDTPLMAESLHLLGCSYAAQQNYRDGKEVLLRLQALCPTYLSDQDYKNLALVYFSENNLDSVSFYQKRIKNNNPAISWIDYNLHTLKENYPQALRALEIVSRTQDSIIRHALNQNINSTLVQYYKQEEEMAAYKLKHEKQLRIGISIFGFLFIIALYIFYHIHLQTKQRKLEDTILFATELRDKLLRQESEMQKRKGFIDELLKQKFDTIDKLCSTYYECQNTERERKRIHTEVIGIISQFREDLHTQKELETFLDTYRDNLMSKFRHEFPQLKEADYQLFLYHALSLSQRSICIFLQEKSEVVYNRKNRLKNKIQNSRSDKKELFMRIID